MSSTPQNNTHFGALLKSIRESNSIHQEILAYGLFSTPMLSYIENGERLPNYQMRNRLMSRLGISAEGFEDLLQPEEFNRYQHCRQLIHAIENEETNLASSLLAQLIETSNNNNKIEAQFLLDMKGRLMQQLNRPKHEIQATYYEAILLTIPSLDKTILSKAILAPEEYFLILQYLECSPYNKDIFEGINFIINKIHNEKLSTIAKAKIYPKAAIIYSNTIINQFNSDAKLLKKALYYTNNSVNSLQDAKRLYYIEDLLKAKESLLLLLSNQNTNTKEMIEDNRKLLSSFHFLLNKYPTSVTINNDCYIYQGSEKYCIGDVIRKRRKMLGLSQKELSDSICSIRTLSRIEQKQKSAQQDIINLLFKRLYLPPGYRRFEIMTKNYPTVESLSNAENCSINRDELNKNRYWEDVRTNLDLLYIQNKQEIIRWYNIQQLQEDFITKEEFLRRMWKGLALSGVSPHNAFIPGNYLTKIERSCLYNIAEKSENLDQYLPYIIHYADDAKEHEDISIYELGMTWCASEIGNHEDYRTSTIMTKNLIQLMIKYRRATIITSNSFNVCWNEAKSSGDIDNPKYLEEIKHILAISIFFKENNMISFLKERISLINNAKDWTI